MHDTAYQKNVAYKKVNDYKYTRTIRRATVTGFFVSFLIFQFMGSLWPEIFNPVHPKIAKGGNSAITWTTKADFDEANPHPNIDTATTPGEVKIGQKPIVYNVQPTGDITSTSPTITASYTASAGINTSTVVVELDSQAVQGCTAGETSVSCATSGLAAGNHTLEVSVTDNSGNTGISSGSFTVVVSATIATEIALGDSVTGYDCTDVGTWDNSTKTCTLTSDLYFPSSNGIEIFYNNLTLDGNGHTIIGSGEANNYAGVNFMVRQNVTIKNLVIKNFRYGVYIVGPSAVGNTIKGNSFIDNTYGVMLSNNSTNNLIYNNNFISNSTTNIDNPSASGNNIFNQSLPVGGNYFDNWTSPDANSDGIVDNPYVLTYGQDNFPWVTQNGWKPTVSNVQPTDYVSSASPTVSASYADKSGTGINTGSVVVKVDGTTLTGCTVTDTSVSCPTSGLSNSVTHTITGSVTDNAGNTSQINGFFTVSTNLYNTSATLGGSGISDIGLRADAGSGIKSKWSTITSVFSSSLTSGQGVKYLLRTSEDGSNWTIYGRDGNTVSDMEAGFNSNYYGQVYGGQEYSAISSSIPPSRYAELIVRLISSGSDTPAIDSISLSYDALENINNSDLLLTKTDGTSLKNSSGTTIGAGIAGGWINQTSVRVTTTGLTCTGCGTSTNIRPEVEIKQTGTAFDESLTYTATAGSSYVDVTLPGTPSSGQGYHLRVRAVDDEGRVSAWTSYGGNSDPNDADISYDSTNPSQAGNPSGTTPTSDTTPAWNWTASTDTNSGISYYKVYWDTVVGGTANSENTTTDSYTHSVVLANGTWYAKVEAYDNAGNTATISGNGSIVVDSTSPDMGAITASVSSGGAQIDTATWQTDNDPYFSWSAPGDTSGISGYYYALDDTTPESGGTWTTSTNVQYGDNAVSDGVHTLYVRAKDNAGNEAGTLGTFVIWVDSIAPSLTLDPSFTFSATDTNSDDITLSWGTYSDSGSPVSNYTLERLKYSEYTAGSHNLTSEWSIESSYLSLGNKTGNSDMESVPGEVDSSVRYAYRIKVNDLAGNSSAWLISDIGMTTDTVNPSNPSSVTATACDGTVSNCSNIENGGYEIKLSWTASSDSGSGVTGYKVYRRAETNSTTANDFTLVGYLDVNPPGLGGHATTYYDNDTNNDATFTDATYDPDSGTGGIQNIKTSGSNRLNDYTDYHYRITALDESGNETDVITTDGLEIPTYANYDADKTKDVTIPSTPQNVVSTPMGLDSSGLAQRVDLSWNTSTDTRTSGRVPAGSGSGISGYKVLKCEGDSVTCSNDGNYTQIGTPTSATYTEEGLGEFTRYFYKVIAVDSASSANIGDTNNNNSIRSASATVLTASNTVPTVPLSVTVTTKTGNPNTDSGVGHQNTVAFNGSYAKNCSGGARCITGYEIYRSTDNFATNNTLIANVSLGAVGDERAVTYTYIDNNSTNDSTSPSISRSSGGGPTVTKAQTARLSDATTYYYKVKAKDNTPANPDGGPFSSGLSAVTTGTLHAGWDTTSDDTAPNIPASVAVKNIHPNNSMVRNIITWTMISDSTRNGTSDFSKYQVYRYETLLGAGTASLISEKTDRGDNYHVDGIVNAEKDKDYSYYVVALDNAGTDFKYANNQVINSTSNMSGYESPVSINPGSVNPTVSNIQVPAGNIGVSSAVVTWTTNQNTDSLVEYKVKGTNDVVAAGKDRTQPTMSHSVTLGNLSKGTQYQYRVISRNSLGNIDEDDATNWREFTTNSFSIADVAVETTTGTATVRWNTNIASDSYVEYKLEGSSDKSKIAGDSTLTTGHEVSITGLAPSKRYTYKIRSVTSDKYIAETAFQTFVTKDNDLNQFVTVPAETNVSEKNVTATTAKITWVTAVPTTSWVEYGTTPGLYSMSAGNNDFNTSHSVELTNLNPGTKYYYRVKGETESEIEYFSPESSFTAVLLPEISNLRVREFSSYQATITFDTNVDTIAAVSYGKDTSYGQRVSKAKSEKNHVITLEGLEDNSTYHFQVSAVDQFKNEAKSSDTTFATPLDTKGPEITDLKVDVLPISESSETASVIISWTTDKPSTTQVEYDDKGAGDKYENHSTEDTSLNTSHTVLVKDLNTSSNYRFRLIAKDKRGNLTKTKSSSFITPTKEKSLLQIIIKSLEDTFSWTKNVPSFLGRIGNRLLGK